MSAVTPDPTDTTPDPSDTRRDGGGETGSLVGASLAEGRYRLHELLGTGGMGLVHRGHDHVLGRDVAIKLLADNLAADAEARTRFQREAQAAARLTHPNVVQVYDVGEDDGRPYFVMELVDGPSLADLLARRGTLPTAEVEAIAIDALKGLARAHGAGLLHRDLKPGNLMRAPDGTVKVTDFGVAQATELPQMTRTGLVLGTLPYLAPERLTGAPASVRTDLYGFGATLLELLTGAPPDSRTDTAGHQLHTAEDLDTVPPRLTYVIQVCLARDPEERPESAEEVLDLLTAEVPLPPAEERREVTQVLPAAAQIPTEVVADHGRSHRGDTARDAGAADPHPTATGTARSRGWTRWAVLALLAGLLLVVLLAQGRPSSQPPTTGSTPDGTATTPAQPAGDGGDGTGGDTGPPPGDDPAETVRNLSEWIRDQAG